MNPASLGATVAHARKRLEPAYALWHERSYEPRPDTPPALATVPDALPPTGAVAWRVREMRA